jgi:hypothetical protein
MRFIFATPNIIEEMQRLSHTLCSVLFISSLFIGATVVAHGKSCIANFSENDAVKGANVLDRKNADGSTADNNKQSGTFNSNSTFSTENLSYTNNESSYVSATGNDSDVRNRHAVNLVPAPLTIDLLQFNAAFSNGDVLLNWETAHETEGTKFVVEYSNNGSSWEKIGSVSAGHSIDFNSYQFTHFNAGAALNLYRLKMIDAGGKFSYSAARSVALKNVEGGELNVYPNPFADGLQLEYQNSDKHNFVKIFITDVTGKLLQMSDWTLAEGLNKTTLALKKLPDGIYFLTLRNNTNGAVMLQRKIIKN